MSQEAPLPNELGRRRLLSGVAGVALATPLIGCSGRSDRRLRVAFSAGGSRESLDPHTANRFVDQARAKALFDTLVAYDDDMSVRARLAESWESDRAGKRWRIRLRSTRFHDGSRVRAEDVLYSLRRVADPKTASPSADYFAHVDFTASRAVSDKELELVLGNPDFEFPSAWGAPATEIVPAGTRSFRHPVGSGPFRFVSFEPDKPAVFRRFAGHWSGKPALRELEFLPVNDESARVNALLSGQVQYAHDLAVPSAKRLEDDDRTAVLRARHTTMQAVAMRLNRPPFDDARLVRAVLDGVDREALLRVALGGRGELGNDMFGKGLRGYASDIPQRHRDVHRARALVREAGANGLRFDLETSAVDPAFEAAAPLIAEQLGEIGLKVRPNTRAASTYFDEIETKGVAAQTRTATLPLHTFLAQRFRTRASQNNTGFSAATFDRLLNRASATEEESTRLRLLGQAQRIVHDRAGLLVWGFGDWLIGVADEVSGLRAAPPNSFAWARFDNARLG